MLSSSNILYCSDDDETKSNKEKSKDRISQSLFPITCHRTTSIESTKDDHDGRNDQSNQDYGTHKTRRSQHNVLHQYSYIIVFRDTLSDT